MYKLKSRDGKVNAMLKTGKDFVRNRIPTEDAQRIMDNGKLVRSSVKDYPICVDKLWYFEGEYQSTRKGEQVK